jgi:hypothetical protein
MVTDYDSSSFEEVCALADAEGARRSEPDEVARLAKLSTPTASTPTCGRNANVSGATTLPGRPGAPCGCGLVIYPRRPMIACGQESAPANLLTISPGCSMSRCLRRECDSLDDLQ